MAIVGKHPSEMTMAELEALPTVNRLFRAEWSFVAANGLVWDVGASGTIWVKAVAPKPPAAISQATTDVRQRA